MDTSTRALVRERAGNRCEYCQLHQDDSPLAVLHVEHIIPKKHGGSDDPDNLALACIDCNLHKGPNLTGIDPETNEVTELFHPRHHWWGNTLRGTASTSSARQPSAVPQFACWTCTRMISLHSALHKPPRDSSTAASSLSASTWTTLVELEGIIVEPRKDVMYLSPQAIRCIIEALERYQSSQEERLRMAYRLRGMLLRAYQSRARE